MKKYLLSALALPLLFACSSDDIFEQETISNDQFAGIEKVDATFSMADEALTTRMDNGSWNPQEGDLWGFAWLGDGSKINPATDGIAYQNHNLIQTGSQFKPQTSIYVGKYFIYRPYDKTTVSPQAINFKSLEEQTLAEGYASTTDAWKNLAKTAINIGDQWTDVSTAGTTDASGKVWDKAGIDQNYKLYAAMFSNQTGLDLTYVKNNPSFAAATAIAGATDIAYSYTAGTSVGAADIYGGTVDLDGAAKSFTYAPKATPTATHVANGVYWADKSNLGAAGGFTFTDDVITLTAEDEDGVPTEGKTTGWFWFNSLPATTAGATSTTAVTTVLNTSYGAVTVKSTVGACAYALEVPTTGGATAKEWIKLAAADDETKSPKEWNAAAAFHNTFVNQYGNHKGKYALTVDFSKGVMNNMHVKNDAHLQKLLRYYIASGKNNEANVVLNLDGKSATDKTFKISKISIALLQTINAGTNKVKVQACTTHNNPVKIIVTQEGQSDLGLAAATEVPALDNVFAVATGVFLASNTTWTWSGNVGNGTVNGAKALKVDNNVTSITNEGTLTVNATNVELWNVNTNALAITTLANAKGATMNITQVTTVKNALTNLGTINVGGESNTSAELRAYGVEIKNDAETLPQAYLASGTEEVIGTINNYGVVGSTSGTSGEVNNYGLINMMNDGAMTLLKSNEKGTDPFASAFNASSNKMGTVVLPENNPTAIVSVNNAAENGFIKYTWTGKTYTTPEGNVKYNTIVVSDDIEFTEIEAEIQYVEFNGSKTKVINTGKLSKLKGVIVNADKSIIIEKGNTLNPSKGAYLGTGATVYKGGIFRCKGAEFAPANTTMYLGTWSLDQIVEY